jgi:heme-degrading monooxygenase HmoA
VIRVIYRWQVAPENFDEFQRTWSATTHRIHETVPGALGSFILRACEDGSEILTVAKWDCIESWRSFWGNKNPKEMEQMRKLGQQISVEAYDEIEDYTR